MFIFTALSAAIRHIGKDTQEGHYTAFCRRDYEWYLFDDQEVTKSMYDVEYIKLASLFVFEKGSHDNKVPAKSYLGHHK